MARITVQVAPHFPHQLTKPCVGAQAAQQEISPQTQHTCIALGKGVGCHPRLSKIHLRSYGVSDEEPLHLAARYHQDFALYRDTNIGILSDMRIGDGR